MDKIFGNFKLTYIYVLQLQMFNPRMLRKSQIAKEKFTQYRKPHFNFLQTYLNSLISFIIYVGMDF